ncbi:uncharacterized protein LOC131965145 [Centropristis striata]|uniref:uncharacterized protein LOC131965145 n=1 Tax=Centropristis striata TaxID=184440 RepID=UPI0027DF1532|nr:uncharacterized protein LOC131965145 [Centropristis striata]
MAESNSSGCFAFNAGDFKFFNVVGQGGFGKVIRCLKKDTRQTVAVKIPMSLQRDSTEVSMMEQLMRLKLDQKHIVEFFGWFHTSLGKALVFEPLDISLEDFIIQRDCAPMLLSDIRVIIQQSEEPRSDPR